MRYSLLIPRGQILESLWKSYLLNIYWIPTVYRHYSRCYRYSSEQIMLLFMIQNAFPTKSSVSIFFLFLITWGNMQVMQVHCVCECVCVFAKHTIGNSGVMESTKYSKPVFDSCLLHLLTKWTEESYSNSCFLLVCLFVCVCILMWILL